MQADLAGERERGGRHRAAGRRRHDPERAAHADPGGPARSAGCGAADCRDLGAGCGVRGGPRRQILLGIARRAPGARTRVERRWEPARTKAARRAGIARWQKGVARSLDWVDLAEGVGAVTALQGWPCRWSCFRRPLSCSWAVPGHTPPHRARSRVAGVPTSRRCPMPSTSTPRPGVLAGLLAMAMLLVVAVAPAAARDSRSGAADPHRAARTVSGPRASSRSASGCSPVRWSMARSGVVARSAATAPSSSTASPVWPAAGLHIDRRGRLWVAGAGSGSVRVYSARTSDLSRPTPSRPRASSSISTSSAIRSTRTIRSTSSSS